jgi:hypothetical protein
MSTHLPVLSAIHYHSHCQIGIDVGGYCCVVFNLDVLREREIDDDVHIWELMPNTISDQLEGVSHVYFPLHPHQQIGLANGLHEVNVGHSGGIGSDELCQDKAD